MAGTVPGFCLTPQFDLLGQIMPGCKLFIYQAGTVSTPQNAYYDTALTSLAPNPIFADNSGRLPQWFVADGLIKLRLTDKNGDQIFVGDNLLVVGPSSDGGGGGGGGQVDPTTIFQTGDVIWQPVSGTREGWVRDNGRTIGSSTSGATERANADCESLFSYLWGKYSNTFCPVAGGRGASASADWSANKTIQLLDFSRCVPGGLDGMGNTASGDFDDVPVVTGDATTAGSIIGEIEHQLLKAELPTDKPTGTIANGAITISPATINAPTGFTNGQSGSDRSIPTLTSNVPVTASQAASTFTGDALGSGTAHNNVQRTMLGTMYRKL